MQTDKERENTPSDNSNQSYRAKKKKYMRQSQNGPHNPPSKAYCIMINDTGAAHTSTKPSSNVRPAKYWYLTTWQIAPNY